MASQISTSETAEVFYPDSDDQPMANSTEHFDWLVMIQQNLDHLLADSFVAGDLFWYPIEGRADVAVAPDVMVALGRPKGKRLYYQQWKEENVAPQVVFEILSSSNTRLEMDRKLLFFERHGVEEYYQYDIERCSFDGLVRGEFGLEFIPDTTEWVSPLLQIRFDMRGKELQMFRPDGTPFRSYRSVVMQIDSDRAEIAKHRAKVAKQKTKRLAEKLRALGIDPDAV